MYHIDDTFVHLDPWKYSGRLKRRDGLVRFAGLCRITQCSSVSDFQKLDSDIQKAYAVKLYSERLSMGQIARLTGMSKAMVFRAVKKSRDTFDGEQESLLRESKNTAYFDASVIW